MAGNPLNAEYNWSFTTAAFVDLVAPQVLTHAPAANATEVSVSTTVQIQFSEEMDAATLQGGNIEWRNPSGDLLNGSVTYNSATNEVLLTSSGLLNYNTTYQVRVKGGATGVKDLAGNSLTGDFIFSFTTEPDLQAPVVTAVTPAASASAISVGTVATIQFNESMQAALFVPTAFEWVDAANNNVSFTVSYNVSNRTATLTPVQPLGYGRVYTIRVLGGGNSVKDLAGNSLSSSFAWSFATEADITAPAVVTVSPVANSVEVPVTSAASVLFTEDMDLTLINSNTVSIRNSANQVIQANVVYNNLSKTVTITPATALTAATVFTIRVTGKLSWLLFQVMAPK